MPKQTQRRRSLHIGNRHDQPLEACCRGMLQRDNPKLPSSHRHCYQYLNGAKLRLSDLHNDDSRCKTAKCSLMSYPRTNVIPQVHTYIHTYIHISGCGYVIRTGKSEKETTEGSVRLDVNRRG